MTFSTRIGYITILVVASHGKNPDNPFGQKVKMIKLCKQDNKEFRHGFNSCDWSNSTFICQSNTDKIFNIYTCKEMEPENNKCYWIGKN